jgi:hypothetical protein
MRSAPETGDVAMAGKLDLSWESGGTLTVRGTGFVPHERLTLTMTISSGGSSVLTGTGTLVQRSSAVQSSSNTLQADAQGTFQQKSTVVTAGDVDVTVMARGEQGGLAQTHVLGPGTR